MDKILQKAGYTEQQYTNGSVTLNYAVSPPRKHALLLIPGQTMPWQSYTRVLPALAKRFQVYALDLHGHGRSSRCPQRYTFEAITEDLVAFLKNVVQRPAFLSGNSSGGLFVTWMAAQAPEYTQGVIAEDPPFFSSEHPRLQQCFVYHVMKIFLETLDRPEGRDLGAIFQRLEIPHKSGKRISKIPLFLARLLSSWLRHRQAKAPHQPLDIPWLPLQLRLTIRAFSEYDPAFTRAFYENTMAGSFDHAAMLAKIRCPFALVHANWFVHEKFGLVGAMTEEEAKRVCLIVPQTHYIPLAAGHVVHLEAPKSFLQIVNNFANDLGETEI